MDFERQLFMVMFLQVLFPAIILIIMPIARITAVRNKMVKARYFKEYRDSSNVPSFLILIERHYSNLFEMPLLFLICCLTALFFQQIDMFIISCAWVFLVFRLIHSLVHLFINKLLLRMFVFGVSCMAMFLMWIALAKNILFVN